MRDLLYESEEKGDRRQETDFGLMASFLLYPDSLHGQGRSIYPSTIYRAAIYRAAIYPATTP